MVVSNLPKSLRSGKMLVDWSQNDPYETILSIYSLRAKDKPAVSTPDTSDEVATALKRRNAKSLTFDSPMVLKRVKKLGDLFAPVLKLKQQLPALKAI